ncbi:hypothetical protein [Macrococcus capreoli]|uniref:hypothetical protein n=1 Tax=Macrococcus capreoli TaxID=2982690 RepID=UPI003EE802DC
MKKTNSVDRYDCILEKMKNNQYIYLLYDQNEKYYYMEKGIFLIWLDTEIVEEYISESRTLRIQIDLFFDKLLPELQYEIKYLGVNWNYLNREIYLIEKILNKYQGC